jgi:hypothetical protein
MVVFLYNHGYSILDVEKNCKHDDAPLSPQDWGEFTRGEISLIRKKWEEGEFRNILWKTN